MISNAAPSVAGSLAMKLATSGRAANSFWPFHLSLLSSSASAKGAKAGPAVPSIRARNASRFAVSPWTARRVGLASGGRLRRSTISRAIWMRISAMGAPWPRRSRTVRSAWSEAALRGQRSGARQATNRLLAASGQSARVSQSRLSNWTIAPQAAVISSGETARKAPATPVGFSTAVRSATLCGSAACCG